MLILLMTILQSFISLKLKQKSSPFRFYLQRAELFVLIALSLSTVASAEQIIRVATFNLRNYLSVNRMVNGIYLKDYPKPESEKKALYAIIKKVNPDILCIQEIGTLPYLNEFQRDLNSQGIHYPYSALMQTDNDVRFTAVLSKIAFTQVTKNNQLEFKYFGEKRRVKRGLMQVSFKTEGISWNIFNLHLASRFTVRKDDPQSHKFRQSEALVIRNSIKKKYPSHKKAKYLIVGDFNDTKKSKPLKRFLKSGKQTLSIMIPCKDSRGEAWTYFYAKEDVYSRVDFILASPSFFPYVKNSEGIIFDQPPTLKASDHRLVYLDLTF
jgi:endonuclease/exonuclease/phosphatase family metal-dependent hydrolase